MKKPTVLEKVTLHIEDKIRKYQQEYEDTDKSYSMIRGCLMIQIRTLVEVLDTIEKQTVVVEATKHVYKKV